MRSVCAHGSAVLIVRSRPLVNIALIPVSRPVFEHLFPVFPRFGKVALYGQGRTCRFALAQEIDGAQTDGFRLLPGVHLSVDRAVYRLADAASHHGSTMAPHQHDRRIAESLGQGGAQIRGGDQQARILSGGVANFEYRRAYAYERAYVTNGPKRNIGHSKGNDRGRMAVYDRHDLGACPENFAVDKAFQRRLLNLADRTAVQFELLDVRHRHRGRRPRLGHEKQVRMLIVPRADMSEPVEHALIRENSIGQDQVFDQCRIGGVVGIHRMDFFDIIAGRKAEVRILTEKSLSCFGQWSAFTAICIGNLNHLFSGPSHIAGPASCQSLFCLMKIPMLLRLAWAIACASFALPDNGIMPTTPMVAAQHQ